MSAKSPEGSGQAKADAKKERLAAALRENLQRRKTKSRSAAASDKNNKDRKASS